MADERTTSQAKDVQFDTHAENTLDRQQALSGNFNNQNLEQATDFERSTTDGGSTMVREDAPGNDNRPPPEMARAQDRETFDKKWANEQDRAKLQEEYNRDRLAAYDDEIARYGACGQSHDQELEFSRYFFCAVPLLG